MRFFTAVTALSSLVAALPSPLEELKTRETILVESYKAAVEARGWKSGEGGTANELLDGGACPQAIFIHARGTTEGGNLGTMGNVMGLYLESKLGAANVWVQGVGGAYKAALLDNLLSEGTTQGAIDEMKNLLIRANKNCPNSKIVAAGYSQGGAVIGAAIRDSSAAIREQIKGVIMFGWTKSKQNNGKIPNYPVDRLLNYCESGDLICAGTLIVLPAHLTYHDEAAGPAPEFLLRKIRGQ
ncbi:family 5 putative carbohydrate esterase [Podospora fimiseda]|uniref:cutinase n=1 Tax=Podospora fimiseda TaxID=252190 RepID=A0AAN6YR80_9PEZI|nr:family 5 putative carbohydrate esterase [Podospora fimiseda]